MRIALKHQILMAPAAVLLLMTLLLGFLQFTYWGLSQQREQVEKIGKLYILQDQAEKTFQTMFILAQQHELHSSEFLVQDEEVKGLLERLVIFHAHFRKVVRAIVEQIPQELGGFKELLQTVDNMNPRDLSQFGAGMARLQPQFAELLNAVQQAQKLRRGSQPNQKQDIDKLMDRAALVSIIVLGAAIPIGILLSLFFSRRILRRVQRLSDTAGSIVRGDLTPPAAPEVVRDELDDLALSINRMTEQLIRVVGTEKLLEGAEEERRRIAMDIHDQTLSDLSSILRGLQVLQKQETCRDQAEALEDELKGAITDLRHLMDNLHPQTLDILGLGAALQSHLERCNGKGDMPEYHLYISPEVDASGLPRLSKLTLYRIAVEAIHNVIKHARASRYEVNLDLRGDQVVLSVEDNGVGFDTRHVTLVGGRGLNNIRERSRAIGGQVAWSPSRFSTGTRFELTLAVPAARGEIV